MSTAYLDKNNDVVALSTIPRTLEVVRVKNPAVVKIIQNAPEGLCIKGCVRHKEHYHHKHRGSGKKLSHYKEQPQIEPEPIIVKHEVIDDATRELIVKEITYKSEASLKQAKQKVSKIALVALTLTILNTSLWAAVVTYCYLFLEIIP